MHITRSLLHHDASDGSNDGTANAGGSTVGTANATATPGTANTAASSTRAVAGTAANGTTTVQLTQEVEPEVAAQNSAIPSNENADMYSKLTNNMVLQQKTLLTNVQSDPNTVTPSQPSWNDPQIHISSASGKSVTCFLDICDFVQCTVEEEVVLWGSGRSTNYC